MSKLYDNDVHQHFGCLVFEDSYKESAPTSMREKNYESLLKKFKNYESMTPF